MNRAGEFESGFYLLISVEEEDVVGVALISSVDDPDGQEFIRTYLSEENVKKRSLSVTKCRKNIIVHNSVTGDISFELSTVLPEAFTQQKLVSDGYIGEDISPRVAFLLPDRLEEGIRFELQEQ